VPHFEKMLYDNALLVSLLAEAYKVTKSELYKETIEQTLEWVGREMTGAGGSFYSAQDADSEGIEGKYYVWDKTEIEQILGNDAPLFCEFYDVSGRGNWEGKNILWRKCTFEEFAQSRGMESEALKRKLAVARQKLFDVRHRRIHPALDDKILLDWNALICSAYAKAYSALGLETYRKAAEKNLRFLFEKMVQPDGLTLYHTYKDGKAQYDGFLDDYAFLIEALVDVYEITFDTSWLLQAERYMAFVLDHFLDASDKLFYFTSAKQQDILLRKKDLYDSATPSGNATMVRNLQRLGILLGHEEYRKLASKMLGALKKSVEKYPGSFARWATAMLSEAHGIPEIAVVGCQAATLAAAINAGFLPQKVLMAATNPNGINYPLLMGKTAGSDTLIYYCRDYACQQPVRTVEEFRQLVHPFIVSETETDALPAS